MKSVVGLLRRPLFWIVLVVLVALIAGGVYYYSNSSAIHAPSTVVVSRGDLKATVTANARVQAITSARLAFPFSGMIIKVNVQEGDTVKKGDVLAEMDSSDQQRRVQAAQFALDTRQDALTAAQQPPAAADLEIAQQTLKKAALALAAAQDRYKKDASSDNEIAQELAQSDYDIARANFDRQTAGPSQNDLDQLKRAVASAQADLQDAQTTLAQTKLTAPFDGVITEVDVTASELMGGFTSAISMADTTKLELLADVDEIDVADVQDGQSVDLRFDAFPGDTATGKVTRLYPAASTDRGSTVYHAVIALDPTDLKLRPGMGATVNIATVEKKGVLRVPSRAIKSAGSQKIVSVQDGSATRNVVVQTGLSDGNDTEIISGVQEGTVVIVD